MNDLNHAMLLILSLDPGASLKFSESTQKWYVKADIDISTGELIGGITCHRDTPEAAVFGYLYELQEVHPPCILVTNTLRDRRHWKWNGAAFKEEPVSWFMNRARS